MDRTCQTPEFEEYSLALHGLLRVKTRTKTTDIKAGEACIVSKGEWEQYSTPESNGAGDIVVCVPAFSLKGVHRDLDSTENFHSDIF
jgi:hypothetical protein